MGHRGETTNLLPTTVSNATTDYLVFVSCCFLLLKHTTQIRTALGARLESATLSLGHPKALGRRPVRMITTMITTIITTIIIIITTIITAIMTTIITIIIIITIIMI